MIDLEAYARLGVAVAVLALLIVLTKRSLIRRLERLERDRDRDLYWRAYSDVLADLGGGGTGEPSGDISVPRR
jgi:hypothetical protein